jgi:hypothetical protein
MIYEYLRKNLNVLMGLSSEKIEYGTRVWYTLSEYSTGMTKEHYLMGHFRNKQTCNSYLKCPSTNFHRSLFWQRDQLKRRKLCLNLPFYLMFLHAEDVVSSSKCHDIYGTLTSCDGVSHGTKQTFPYIMKTVSPTSSFAQTLPLPMLS